MSGEAFVAQFYTALRKLLDPTIEHTSKVNDVSIVDVARMSGYAENTCRDMLKQLVLDKHLVQSRGPRTQEGRTRSVSLFKWNTEDTRPRLPMRYRYAQRRDIKGDEYTSIVSIDAWTMDGHPVSFVLQEIDGCARAVTSMPHFYLTCQSYDGKVYGLTGQKAHERLVRFAKDIEHVQRRLPNTIVDPYVTDSRVEVYDHDRLDKLTGLVTSTCRDRAAWMT